MKKLLGAVFAIASTSLLAMAGEPPIQVPEINPASAMGALTLLGGSILILRARLKK